MTERPRRSARGSRSASWEPESFDPLPKRERARKRIETEQIPPLPPLEGGRRKLSSAEREQLRERHSVRRTPPASPRRAAQPARRRGWWSKGVLFGLFAILVGSIGAGRYFGGEAEVSATPTAAATATAAQVAFVPSPPVILLTPTATDTPIPTDTPSPTPTITPSPTPNPAFVGKVICLDPGHGGSDRGFTREADEVAPAMEEAVVTLELAKALKPRLEALGFTVVLTRDSDTDVNASSADVNGDELTYDYWKEIDPAKAKRVKDVDELQARIFACNNANADLLISMHINGYDDPSVSGYETWYSSARPFSNLNKRFAQIVFDELGKQITAAGYNAHAREVNDDATANVQANDVFDRYVITGPAQPGQIVPSAMPGAIVETLFLSNDDDAAFLASAKGKAAIVTAYAQAIITYFDELGG
jgi:N-acetylmuramoyl-L-alanine amidase